MDEAGLREQFTKLGQEHLFDHWEKRTDRQRRRLLNDLSSLDLDLLKLLDRNLRDRRCDGGRNDQLPDGPLQPLPVVTWREWRHQQAARELGEEALAKGKVGFLTVAGGQGSRLGFEGPKGMFPISPIRKASLFQITAEKIGAARARYRTPLYWYIMTSSLNHQATLAYFKQNAFWGLPEEEVVFFSQGLNPSLSEEGRLLLAPDGGLFKNPDGHGGVFKALKRDGHLEGMRERGVEEVHCFQVDNPLVNLPDPSFLGFHRLRGSEMSSKVIAKAYPEEKLGVPGLIGGKRRIIEYSDLDKAQMYARDSRGKLYFSYGSIAIHLLNVSFMQRLEANLPPHQARKKVQILEPGAGKIATREAVKFEMFIFDAIPEAVNPLFLETRREAEFAPLKNKSGQDSIETCLRGIIEKYAAWLEQCGVKIPRDDQGRSLHKIEINPAFASDLQTLKHRLRGATINVHEDILLT